MKRLSVVVSVSVLLLAGAAAAQDTLVDSVRKGCAMELSSFCKDVTPGEGRGLACLYAYGDKLSGACEYALYDAAVQLERAVAALSYVANECGDDIEAQCADVALGQGRVLACLKQHDAKVSARCKQAVKTVGLDK